MITSKTYLFNLPVITTSIIWPAFIIGIARGHQPISIPWAHIGNYTLGAMYLKASEQDKSNSSDGYVLTAKYGYNRSWIPGTYEIDTYYYDMAGTTYINHTMSGLGSYMNGFKGYSAGWYLYINQNILLGIEYYDLKDKTSLDNVKTWWGQVSYSF
ncbi:hypothetical protein [Pectinatus frisingensis]|uniref:hypothetical protein n=1 Tax=Pectinatus frisingensis TaxID=865 RepID=UPI0018C5F8D3|nr:hypothetical protein [Pectinatus frisingensis]